ncbi:hypothetical protein [Cryobacterium sp. MDB2-10]|uniref:hypothetical protein n=1 Tax=Cryobacterium sp. MDB2-10 TaxID=1259177 RepID=UPI00142F9A21|nr:hypothetical protein [Cryobacterium sp. MDB2-10]
MAVFLVGVMLTSVGLATASTSGGTYLIFGGAMVFGPIQIIRGALSVRRTNAALMANLHSNAPLLKLLHDQDAYAKYLKTMRAGS